MGWRHFLTTSSQNAGLDICRRRFSVSTPVYRLHRVDPREWASLELHDSYSMCCARPSVKQTAGKEISLKGQHLTQLDGLAAAAAHELGTPLATIKLVARDLEKQFHGDGQVAEDLALLLQEAERCRKILSTLTSLGGPEPGDIIGTMSLSLLIEEVVSPQRDFGISIEVVKAGAGVEPKCGRKRLHQQTVS